MYIWIYINCINSYTLSCIQQKNLTPWKKQKKTTTLSHTHTSVLRAIKVRPQNGTHSRGTRSEEQSLIIPTTNPQSQWESTTKQEMATFRHLFRCPAFGWPNVWKTIAMYLQTMLQQTMPMCVCKCVVNKFTAIITCPQQNYVHNSPNV